MRGIRGKLCAFVSLPSGARGMVEELKVVEKIAAVRMGDHVVGGHIEGVAVVIPAGEVIRFDRAAPLLDQMLPVEWNGSSYGVFPEDLLERADKATSHRVDNPGIVPIHPA
jgi:hypothetical protein